MRTRDIRYVVVDEGIQCLPGQVEEKTKIRDSRVTRHIKTSHLAGNGMIEDAAKRIFILNRKAMT
jgi:hypothetical protein